MSTLLTLKELAAAVRRDWPEITEAASFYLDKVADANHVEGVIAYMNARDFLRYSKQWKTPVAKYVKKKIRKHLNNAITAAR